MLAYKWLKHSKKRPENWFFWVTVVCALAHFLADVAVLIQKTSRGLTATIQLVKTTLLGPTLLTKDIFHSHREEGKREKNIDIAMNSSICFCIQMPQILVLFTCFSDSPSS